MALTSVLLRAVQDAVRRIPGSFVASSIEAAVLPGMGVGIVAKERIPKDSLIFQASQEAWYPFSAECALQEAQRKAPGFVQQLDALVASSPALRDRSSFVPNALLLGTHLAMAAPTGQAPPPPAATDSDSALSDAYLQSLPEFVDLPFYWDEMQFDALDGCREVRQSIQQSAQLYFQLYQHLFGSANQVVPLDRYFWSISVLMSRATSGANQPFTLIPFFDWFNHTDRGDECVHEYDSQQLAFVVHTTREYAAGEQLFINYGNHSNTRLMRNYGFTTPNNSHDTVALSLPAELQQLDPNDPHANDKATILQALGGHHRLKTKSITLTSDGLLSVPSQQWLHMRLADPTEFQALVHQTTSPHGSSSVILPATLEHKIQRGLDQLCGSRLRQHKHSIQHDEEFLATHKTQMAPWLRGAMRIRLSEKQILTKAMTKQVLK